ncbi:DEAD/DEAH box helicase family protein [Opitutales bacterium]|nr:DEAD/DEAH box helicase family protein [Opitutales bacterium]
MKSTNFEFLRDRQHKLADLGGFAENYAMTDAPSCFVKLRTYIEEMVQKLFEHHSISCPYDFNLHDLLSDHSFQHVTPRVVLDKFHLIRIRGNKAAHGSLTPQDEQSAFDLVVEAFDLGRWFYITVLGGQQDEIPSFIRPQTEDVEELKRKSREAERKLIEKNAQLQKTLDQLESTRKEAETAKKTQVEMEALLNQAQQVADVLEFSEEETRLKLIDAQLRSVGWDVGENLQSTTEVGQEIKIHDQPTDTGIGYADYVLWANDGIPLAVVEAKKTAVDAERGKMQAKIYADGLEKKHGFRPIIFYTNGYDIWIWKDGKNEPPRKLFGFYSKDSLEYERFQDAQQADTLASLEPRQSIVNRPYQIEAIKRVSEHFDSKHRKALLVQATGTGKTRIAIALCELMVRAKWAKRILFLCDRRELVKQGNEAFKEHLPGEPRVIISRNTHKDRNQKVYVGTYPAMIKQFQNFDVGFFDLVIADESHRSIFNRYRDLFKYFDAFQVGLTATPVAFINRNTFGLFGCEDKDPTANYTLEEAVSAKPAKFLCPFQVMKHTTKFLRDGLKYNELTEEQQFELETQTEDPESVNYKDSQIAKSVYLPETDRLILRNLMENGIRNADGSRVGKTIVFARNHKHAKQLVEIFDQEFPQYGGDFCLRIDSHEPRAEQLIDDFKSRDGSKNLTIAVSVDMLDTGIDVPDVVNLVFAKPVKSLAKFWQMIGRGTRLCPNLFGPGRNKEYFQIFDHYGNFEYFDELDKENDPSTNKGLLQQLFETRISLAETAHDKQERSAFELAKSLVKADVSALPEDCLCVREKWREKRAVEKEGVIDGFQPSTLGLLRDQIAPLMQWRDTAGNEAAYRFDLLIARLQETKLNGSADFENLRDEIIAILSSLEIRMNQVEEKETLINQAKETAYYENGTTETFEELRKELRGLIKFARRTIDPGLEAPTFHISEDDADIRTEVHPVKLEGLDLIPYRNRVESVLRRMIEKSELMRKVWMGERLQKDDVSDLVQQVLIEDPSLNLEELLVHFPNKSESIELAIRQVIGLAPEKIEQSIQTFLSKHPGLNANQMRFLELIKNYLSKYGTIEPEKLWEKPFTTVSAEGLDGVFPQGEQIEDLVGLIREINEAA